MARFLHLWWFLVLSERTFLNEEALLQGLEDTAVEEEVLQGHLQWMRLCISKSWWRGARRLLLGAHRRLPKTSLEALDYEVRLRTNDVKQKADELMAFAEEVFRDQRHGLDEVHCALQWAQNSTTVFVGVKYASRWSAPGAIEVKDVEVNVSDKNFSLQGFGHHSSIRKRYVVELPLFAPILAKQSSWSAASVGRLTATLRKAKPEKWTKLTGGKSKHPITSWLDMEERWADELRRAASPQPKDSKDSEDSKDSKAKDATDVKEVRKGQKLQISWQKKWQRQWKKLPKPIRKVLPWLLLGVGSFVSGSAMFVITKGTVKSEPLPEGAG